MDNQNEELHEEEFDDEFEDSSNEEIDHIIRVSGMYQEWFLDYASYVILERAVPHINDGLKPVQRRILHSLRELEDGRFHKVANVIGNTMKYHPHGDASIGDALVQLGQKELLFDMQGNWGNIYTGDRAAAPRYIEVRLSKFALEVVFNHKTTQWLASYDGRGKEPVTLPVKFPLLLAQGVEGIAVGLACKILPHNFNELIDNSIHHLKGKKVSLFPDFPTGGLIDVSNYNDGLRGGKIRVRARIVMDDKKTLKITEIPFGTNTTSLIDSILKANDKGKIKVKKIEDNTAEDVEILIHLKPDVSPDKTIDALYAFTDCEISISPNSAVIENDKPRFLGVNDILKYNTNQTVELLKLELEIKKAELQEQLHFASLEKIFIEEKIYIDFDGKTYEEAIAITFKRLEPFANLFVRPITHDDVVKLLEIRMRRITKHDGDKADELIKQLQTDIEQVDFHLNNLVDFAIDYYKKLKEKYGKGRDRKSEIKSFDNIEKANVAVANEKLYVNYTEGFVGTHLKKGEGEYVCDCSDIDDVIAIRQDGIMIVSKVSDKAFFGKNLLYVGIWKKDDSRTIYNMVYQDGPRGNAYVKRFAAQSITRDKEYNLTAGSPNSKVLYLTVNPNGEAEVIRVVLRPKPKLKNLKFEYDFAQLDIKGRSAKGNILSKNTIHKIELKEEGVSTLGAIKIWFDDVVQRLNTEGIGNYVGAFSGDDKILTIHQAGYYKLSPFSLETKFEEDFIEMLKFDSNIIISAIYFDGEKQQYQVKRFQVEQTTNKVIFITEHKDSFLEIATTINHPKVTITYDKRSTSKEPETFDLVEFISVKGVKAIGNKLTKSKITSVEIIDASPKIETPNHGNTTNPQNSSSNINNDANQTTNHQNIAPQNQILPDENTAPPENLESNLSDNSSSKLKVPTTVEFEIEGVDDTTKNEVEFEIETPNTEPEFPQETPKNQNTKPDDIKLKQPKKPNKPPEPPTNQITLEL